MSEERTVFEEKRLVILLIGLISIIFGLIIGIFIVNNNAKKLPDCADKETLYDINTCIRDAYTEGLSIDEANLLYTQAIETARTKDNTDVAIDLISSRVNFLANNGYCEKAMQSLKDEDLNFYNASAQRRIYSYAMSSSIDCQDESSRAYWEDLLMKTNQEEE